MGVNNRRSFACSIALAGVLALVAGPAAALGLGQIQVKSRPGQPLLAEIPIISSDPAELQGLEVRLAPPETFARVGLQPPTGDVSGLRFEPALDARGRPVIRVTSAAPLRQPLLSFLVEVNSNGIRVVREVSALLDAPRTMAAPLQAPVQAPVVAPSNTVVRPLPAPIAAAPKPAVAVATPVASPAPAPPPVAPAPRSAAAIATVARPAAPPAPAPAVAAPNRYGPVRRGQTLSQIAAQLDTAPGYTLDQTMLALLRSNPDAFIGDDINRLKQGAVLRVPQAGELSHYSASQAAAVVREQMANWRAARRALRQPAAVAAAAAASAPATNGNQPAPRVAAARLEIVPPSASNGRRAGTRSGIQAGGEGNMLRQQLQESKETLVARNAEVQELKSRVAELEKLQQQQQQLLTMKDSELAAAQLSLAQANRQAAQPAATAQTQQPAPAAATAQTQQPQQPAPAATEHSDRAGSMIWMWAGLALIAAALLGWWLTRRRPPAPTPLRGFDTAALAASIPVPGMESPADEDPDAPADAASDADTSFEPADSVASDAQPAVSEWSPTAAAPTWHAGAALAGEGSQGEGALGEGALGEGKRNQGERGEGEPVAADPGQQLELARAYLDLGDDDAARELLRAVLDGRDPVARAEAARLMRDL